MCIPKNLSLYDLPSNQRMKLINRLLSPDLFVITDDGCHEVQKIMNSRGYGCFELNHSKSEKGKRRKYLVHRVSYEFFKGRIPEGQIIMHLCDNPSCINPNHLIAGTQGDNVRDMAGKRRNVTSFVKGSKNPKAKLTESQVVEIKKMLREKRADQRTIAKQYNVSQVLISRIALGKNWTHIA